MRRLVLIVATAVGSLLTAASPSLAQDWPTKPVHILVGFGAGGGTDVATRILADGLSEALGQQFTVENRPGAGGTIAGGIAAKAPKDGYTIVSLSMTLAIDTPGSKHNITGARQAYYEKISKYHLAPLWEVLKGLVTPEPKTQMLPALWKFGEVEKLMLEAGDVITAEEAERRVLVLENPGEPGKSRITNSLFAGIQLIMR